MNKDRRIAVLGTGAIGGTIGAFEVPPITVSVVELEPGLPSG